MPLSDVSKPNIKISGHVKNLVGKKFGMLEVLSLSHIYNKSAYWLCRCDCGKEKICITKGLTSSHTKSCGCTKYIGLLAGGYNKKDYGEARFNDLYLAYKRSATKRGYCFDLDKHEFRILTKGNCFYCGTEPSQVIKARNNVNGEYVYNGVDRTENSIGYTYSNTVSCCRFCNVAKASMSVNDFFYWIALVFNKHLNK